MFISIRFEVEDSLKTVTSQIRQCARRILIWRTILKMMNALKSF